MTLINRLVALGLIGLAVQAGPAAVHAADNVPVVKITANRFHFTPDHITLLKGQPVTLQLTSTDTTHGLMIRTLKIDTDVKPGKVTQMTVIPGNAGTFKAICDHYCGLGHGGMKMTVVVQEAAAQPAAKVASATGTVSK